MKYWLTPMLGILLSCCRPSDPTPLRDSPSDPSRVQEGSLDPIPAPKFNNHIKAAELENLKFRGHRPSLMVVIASYNNEKYAEANLTSVLNQDYSNFRVYYVNDGSKDNTKQVVSDFLESHPKGNLVHVINNKVNKGSHVENQVDTVKAFAKPNDIVVILDGDDELATTDVLTKVAKVYSNYDVWLTYGQYRTSRGEIGHCTVIPEEVFANNSFRKFEFVQSHLRTFYAWLLLKVPEEQLKFQGKFVNYAGDIMEMMPMMELAGRHSAFIDDVLYLYNQENPISDFRIAAEKTEVVKQDILHRTPLPPLSEPDTLVRTQAKKKVGLLFHATGKYNRFIDDTITSARKFFMTHHDVTYFVFTDAVNNPLANDPDVVFVPKKAVPWPMGTMMRAASYLDHQNLFATYDYLYAIDVDVLFVAPVGDEILGDRVGTLSPGYFGNKGTYCSDDRYSAYVSPQDGEVYYAGGLYGGSRDGFLQIARVTTEGIRKDIIEGSLPPDPYPADGRQNEKQFWHDESYLNRFFIDHPPELTLSPAYLFVNGFEKLKVFKPRILIVDKDNNEMHEWSTQGKQRVENELPVFVKTSGSQASDLIVFSKDRPAQLYAFLESLHLHMIGGSEIFVLYRAESSLHLTGYDQVQAAFPSVRFVRHFGRDDFKPTLVDLFFHKSKSAYVGFAVDDIVVTDPFDFGQCLKVLESENAYAFYLRMGREKDFEFNLGLHVGVPTLEASREDSQVHKFSIGSAKGPWNYPNTVDMALYRKSDIQYVIANLDYTNPTQLEGNWATLTGRIMGKTGLVYDHAVLVNIPSNRVSEDQGAPIGMEMNPELLTQRFLNGEKINVEAFRNHRSNSTHDPAAILTFRSRI